jgi:Rhodopirellula transposase DDE domain
MKKLTGYPAEIEAQMQSLYQALSEKDRRQYAAIEAKKLGYGGISYICRLFGCDASSVRCGLNELATPSASRTNRIRAVGGGRKRLLRTTPQIDAVFLEIMSAHTAGSPTDETIKWSNLSRGKIAQALAERGFAVSVTIVDQLLVKHHFRRRQAFKDEANRQVEQRDEQFKTIKQLTATARQQGNPVMSMDVKKKS